MTRLTNTEVATQIGASRSMVSRIRSGDRRPSVQLASRIIKTYVPNRRLPEALAAFDESGDAQAKFLGSLWGVMGVDE